MELYHHAANKSQIIFEQFLTAIFHYIFEDFLRICYSKLREKPSKQLYPKLQLNFPARSRVSRHYYE